MSTPGYLTRDVATPVGTYARTLPVEVLSGDDVSYLVRIVHKQFRVPRASVAFGDHTAPLCDVCARPLPLHRTAGMCLVCQRVLRGMGSRIRAKARVRRLAGLAQS